MKMGVSSTASVEAFVGVGSNLDAEKNILAALSGIQAQTQVIAASRFYRNPAVSPDHRELPPFVNGVLKIRTGLAPWDFKYRLLRGIEGKAQRRRTRDRYGPRTLDLDLLVYGDLEVRSEDLTLPDPDIAVQPFLAVPLAELFPDFCPPDSPLSMKELVDTLDTRSLVYLKAFTRRVRDTLGL